ncbi:polysaccharide deacetylase family protein [Sporosarcina sp. G11-34]|uniref:polysaccharide deacetylase family protein n=1 Tax=Sporosarcina sp. G11-34 TaxID=2849605 RepID=UPI0022A9E83F|nr:polysaccharide deacetylase family protein [Sporosarcina sp. G11-34]
MKKQLLFIIAALTLLISACSGGSATEKTEKEVLEPETTDSEQEQIEEVAEVEEPVVEIVEPEYELDATWGFTPIGDANSKVALLTIDDAPDKRSLDMAKTLKELNAPAIFFVNGHFIDSYEKKEIIKEIHDMGFEIGNHTMTHADLQQLSEDEQREEIILVSDMVEEIIGERPRFFRAPFGQNTDFSRDLVKEDGMLLMNWSYGYDWEKQYMEKDAIADIMINTELLRDGVNLLMHDREWTADALEEIVVGLRGKGYEMLDPALIKGVE